MDTPIDLSKFRFDDVAPLRKEGPATPSESAAAANAGFQGPAAPAKDARQVLDDYLALPVQERARFFLMWDESEQDFDGDELEQLSELANRKGVDLFDAEVFDTLWRAVTAARHRKPRFNGRQSAEDGQKRGDNRYANGISNRRRGTLKGRG